MEAQRLRLTALAVVAILLAPVVALGCADFGADASAVSKVQSSWGPAETAGRAGDYAKALKQLRTSATFLPTIHDASTRRCVASGSNIRIAWASAGEDYLTHHPADLSGAKVAADRAWRGYPMPHNCP